jgi:hypothetical protein
MRQTPWLVCRVTMRSQMGVKDDASRTSVVRAEKPFMGLLPESQTKSWSEAVYSHAWSNSCWELYNVHEARRYPATDMTFDMRVHVDDAAHGSFAWDDSWTYSKMTCPGHPVQSVHETHNASDQSVVWKLTYGPTPKTAVPTKPLAMGAPLPHSMFAAAAMGALPGSTSPPAPPLSVSFSSDFLTYSVVGSDGKALFEGRGLAIYCDGRLYSTDDGLRLESHTQTSGDDGEARGGAYTGVELRWLTSSNVSLVTSAKTYRAGNDVAFEWNLPNGATDTSQARRSRDAVVVQWPVFDKYAFDGTLSWEGSFMGANQRLSVGARGGPTVFFHKAEPATGLAVVGAPLAHWKACSAGENRRWDGKQAWAPGISATVTSLPVGFSHGLWLKANRGVTATVGAWGAAARSWRQTSRAPDVTLEKIGYQTDNGAYYVFCRASNCSKTMLDVKAALDKQGLPMGYLSFQGAGASSSDGKAPWCVSTWGVDGGQSAAYPLSVGELHDALGVPLQLYLPYFCNNRCVTSLSVTEPPTSHPRPLSEAVVCVCVCVWLSAQRILPAWQPAWRMEALHVEHKLAGVRLVPVQGARRRRRQRLLHTALLSRRRRGHEVLRARLHEPELQLRR